MIYGVTKHQRASLLGYWWGRKHGEEARGKQRADGKKKEPAKSEL